MKKFSVLLMFVFIISAFFCVGCNNPDDGDKNLIKVSFAEMVLLNVENTTKSWDNFSAIRKDVNGQETLTLNYVQPEISPLSNQHQTKVNFVLENENEKVYCDNNVRYHKNNNRNYVDESAFDAEEYVEDKLDNYLNEIINFFAEDNSSKLKSSSKTENNGETIYVFTAIINAENNSILTATFKVKNNTLVSVKFEIATNNNKTVDVEIKETTEIVVTPEWFDNDDYKTDLTYEQAEEIASDETLFNNWNVAEFNLPLGYGEEAEYKVVSKQDNKMYSEKESANTYFDGEYLYTFTQGNVPTKQLLQDNEKTQYTFDYIVNEVKFFTFYYFFDYKYEYSEYFEAAKRYEKDVDIVSYKFAGISGTAKFEAICSLYFDLDGNLYQTSCYVKQYNIQDKYNPVLAFELKDLTIKKGQTFENPAWFVES